MLSRRRFLGTLSASVVFVPLVAEAQQAAKRVVAFLHGGWPNQENEAAFRHGLTDAGYVEGRNVTIESSWARGRFEQLPGMAADLVRRQVALIATGTLPAALAAKAATTTIPIVFVIGEDPVKVGLVEKFNQPGGNVTGVSALMNQLAAKRLELAREIAPKAALGWLVNANNPNAEPDTKEVQAVADALPQKLVVVKASNERELDAAFAMLSRERVRALCVNIDSFFANQREQIVALAVRHQLPTIYPLREFALTGGLMSYSASISDAWHQAGIYAGRILRGEKPGGLPVAQPTKFELVINLKTAKALGLTIPPSVMLRADHIIE